MVEKTITPKEAGRMLNRSNTTIYAYIKRGIIRASRYLPGGNYDIPVSEVERLLKIREQNKIEGE